jgi:hypothetical protein
MGTGPSLVPKSNVIPGNPRLSVPWRGGIQRATVPLSRAKKLRLRRTIASPHRTQEAAGSSPASSIERPLYYAIRGVPCASLALWPTIPAEEAVLRQGARSSATRQPTIEANGIDYGVSPLVDGIRAGTVRAHTV